MAVIIVKGVAILQICLDPKTVKNAPIHMISQIVKKFTDLTIVMIQLIVQKHIDYTIVKIVNMLKTVIIAII